MKRRLPIYALLCLGLTTYIVPSFAQGQARNDNDKVISLSSKGLDDDIIISKIKSSDWRFQLGDDDLVALKKAGVGSKVVAAMLDSSVISVAQVTVDGKPVLMQTLGQGKTGGRIGAALTYGIKSVKEKAFLTGPHAKMIAASKQPALKIELPKGESIESYILVQMDKKDDRRELEVASVGGIVGGKSGIRAEAIRKTTVTASGGNVFTLVPSEALKPGEYIVYVVGSADKIKEIFGRGYDFSVE